jgi:hypothetical protein
MVAAGQETGGKEESALARRSLGRIRGVTLIYALMGERKWPADDKCLNRSGETARCEPTNRRFMLPKHVFSLRSSANGLDVSEIARSFGGGGHRHAAGFRLSFDEAAALFSKAQ